MMRNTKMLVAFGLICMVSPTLVTGMQEVANQRQRRDSLSDATAQEQINDVVIPALQELKEQMQELTNAAGTPHPSNVAGTFAHIMHRNSKFTLKEGAPEEQDMDYRCSDKGCCCCGCCKEKVVPFQASELGTIGSAALTTLLAAGITTAAIVGKGAVDSGSKPGKLSGVTYDYIPEGGVEDKTIITATSNTTADIVSLAAEGEEGITVTDAAGVAVRAADGTEIKVSLDEWELMNGMKFELPVDFVELDTRLTAIHENTAQEWFDDSYYGLYNEINGWIGVAMMLFTFIVAMCAACSPECQRCLCATYNNNQQKAMKTYIEKLKFVKGDDNDAVEGSKGSITPQTDS